MHLFTIVSTVDNERDAKRLHEIFQAGVDSLHLRKNVVKISCSYRFGRATIRCDASAEQPLAPRTAKGLKARAAELITEHVVQDKEPVHLLKILNREYQLAQSEDLPRVIQTARVILDGATDYEVFMRGHERRLAEIYSSFYDCLQSSSFVDIDGWIHFRMPVYRLELNDAIDLAVDEYMLDQQYEEFIGLLKCFVQLQDTRMPLIHLQHIEGTDFQILDEKMLPLHLIPSNEGITITTADQELQMEDAVVSSLISLSPAKIVIHTREPELRMIGTIREIFGERAQIYSD